MIRKNLLTRSRNISHSIIQRSIAPVLTFIKVVMSVTNIEITYKLLNVGIMTLWLKNPIIITEIFQFLGCLIILKL